MINDETIYCTAVPPIKTAVSQLQSKLVQTVQQHRPIFKYIHKKYAY